ncbi:unnamed protein product [Mytilus edulis]|uniref:Uncharacterized protein n=1 Tax=Mytilus edulis TaxID=6550 RepID=A0A8S3S440_MYTED|nr:unnamed protein product [Mytilus edulis]
MIELAEGYELALKSLKAFNFEIEEEVHQNETELCKFGILKSTEDSKYELEKQNVLKREKILKDEVEKHAIKLLKELDQRKESLMKSVNDAKNRSEKINKDLDIQKKTLGQAIHSNNANQVFSRYSEEKTSRQQRIDPVNSIFQRLPKFVPGKQVVQDFYLGELIENDDDQKQTQKYESEKQKLLSREKVLMDAVKKAYQKLLTELDQRKEILMKSVNDAENRSENINQDLDFRKKNLSHVLNSNNANEVFSIHSEEKTSRNQRVEQVKVLLKRFQYLYQENK